MRPHHNGADILKGGNVLALVLGQGDESALSKVVGDGVRVVQHLPHLAHDPCGRLVPVLVRLEDTPTEAVWSETFVEVALLDSSFDFLQGEGYTRPVFRARSIMR